MINTALSLIGAPEVVMGEAAIMAVESVMLETSEILGIEGTLSPKTDLPSILGPLSGLPFLRLPTLFSTNAAKAARQILAPKLSGEDNQSPGGISGGGDRIPPDKLKLLPRGGVIVNTSAGWIQIGAPMWTNKDAFNLFVKQGGFGREKDEIPFLIPTTIVIDLDYVPETDGLLPADFSQYMFFVTKGTTFTLIAPTPEVAARLKKFLDLAYRGPRRESLNEEVKREYAEGAEGIPNLYAEITRGFPAAEPGALRHIMAFNEEGVVNVKGVEIKKLAPLVYEITDNGTRLGVVNLKEHPVPESRVERNSAVLTDLRWRLIREKILFEGRPGLLALGSGHGFAVSEETSGFMIWNRGKCVLVDPTSNTVDFFLMHGLPLEAIDGVILSHGHTDHYGNAIPKLLRLLPKIKLYSTPTIFKMLQEQYKLAIGGTKEGPKQWNWVPLTLQTFIDIIGLPFRFDYSFHPVPSLGFEIYDVPNERDGNLMVLFTGDTFADYSAIWRHTEASADQEPVMTRQRATNILRHHILLLARRGQKPAPVFLIEGGIPPIHIDPVKTRETLAEAGRQGVDTSNVRVYHIASDVAAKAGVPKWEAGPAGYMDLSGHVRNFEPDDWANSLLRAIDRIPLLADLPAPVKAALIQEGAYESIPAGFEIFREGALGFELIVLVDGEIQIRQGDKRVAVRPSGLFGEGALLNEARNATVTTQTPSKVLVIQADKAARILGETDLIEKLKQIRKNRTRAQAAVLKSPLNILPASTLDILFSLGRLERIESGEVLIEEGDNSQDVFVIVSGEAQVTSIAKGIDVVRGEGDMIGEMALANNAPRSATVIARGPLTLLCFKALPLSSLMERYPGVGIALRRTAEKRTALHF